MKFKRTLACLFILAAFPLLASPSQSNPVPFASVALAGHTLTGNFACTCGCSSCICDPGETPLECSQGSMAMSDKTGKDASQDSSPVSAALTSNFDFGSSALILALAFFAWARFLRT